MPIFLFLFFVHFFSLSLSLFLSLSLTHSLTLFHPEIVFLSILQALSHYIDDITYMLSENRSLWREYVIKFRKWGASSWCWPYVMNNVWPLQVLFQRQNVFFGQLLILTCSRMLFWLVWLWWLLVWKFYKKINNSNYCGWSQNSPENAQTPGGDRERTRERKRTLFRKQSMLAPIGCIEVPLNMMLLSKQRIKALLSMGVIQKAFYQDTSQH